MKNGSSRSVDIGLLVLRVGIGVIFIVHGVPKFQGGPEKWAALGGAMAVCGITFAPAFWGFMAACAEAVGGLCLALGLFVRPAAFFMLFTMAMAFGMLASKQLGFVQTSHPLSLGVVFLALLITGGGRLALGAAIPWLQAKWFR